MATAVPMIIAHNPAPSTSTINTSDQPVNATTFFPFAFGNMLNTQNHVNTTEFMFSNYVVVAFMLALIIGASLYMINPPQVQKSCIEEPLIEQSPHIPTILGISLITFFILLIIPAFINTK